MASFVGSFFNGLSVLVNVECVLAHTLYELCTEVITQQPSDTISAICAAAGSIPADPVEEALLFTATDIQTSLVLEDDLDHHIIKEEVDEGKGEEVKKKHVRSRVNNRVPFAVILAQAAKAHFGGIPTASRANELSVMKYLASKCEELKVTPTHTRACVTRAFPLVFTPDEDDLRVYRMLNSENARSRRDQYLEARKIPSWWMQLLDNPLCARAWVRMYRRFCGMPDEKAFMFVK
nr:26 kDa replicase protein [Clematis chlorotic mottle virus]